MKLGDFHYYLNSFSLSRESETFNVLESFVYPDLASVQLFKAGLNSGVHAHPVFCHIDPLPSAALEEPLDNVECTSYLT